MPVQLYPPVGTCYFKSYRANLSGNDPHVNLNATFYVYVTNVKPTESQFTERGGKVFIVVVYDGYISSTSGMHSFFLQDTSGLLSYKDQFPVTGSGRKEGDNTIYTIGFSQIMTMFDNGGNSAYNFTAQYSKEFSLTGYTQSTSVQRVQGTYDLGWKLEEDRNPVAPSLNGLQIFEANTLGVAKCSLVVVTVKGWDPYSFQVEFDLDFSARTMGGEVVG
ncbi:hypothetical protein APHAL10511_005774 [Amanita phalloides]|nr:hypothetical protein APHAL10511_005774 [Amanita phalloides]